MRTPTARALTPTTSNLYSPRFLCLPSIYTHYCSNVRVCATWIVFLLGREAACEQDEWESHCKIELIVKMEQANHFYCDTRLIQ